MIQFELCTRYLQKIRNIYKGVSDIHPSGEDYQDDVIAFFVHCHHMYDWICTARGFTLPRARVAAFIDSHEELRVCADVCNHVKHCIVKRTRTETGLTGFSAMDYRISGSSLKGPPIFGARYRITCGSQHYDALELAEKCHALWAAFLEEISAEIKMGRT